MEPVQRFAPSPGTPLFPVSPERANRQQLPGSPSRQSDLSLLQNEGLKGFSSRNSSDVQGKVAQFNNLSKEASQRRKDNEAALKRAVVGREEAESETRRLKEENRQLKIEIEEGNARERKVGERLEAMREEMHRLKETHTQSQALYEKEVRRARKEAFKSSSNLVKLQEELKNTRNKLTMVKEDYEIQKKKVENREQETFAVKYELVGVQEELDDLKQQLRIAEEEKNALKASLKEEEVARIAAEGKMLLPTPAEPDEFSSPRRSRRESGKENVDPVVTEERLGGDEYAILKQELRREKRWRARAVGLIDFMKVECQLGRCSCQIAHNQGTSFTHGKKSTPEPQQEEHDLPEARSNTPNNAFHHKIHDNNMPIRAEESERESSELLIEFSPTTGTFRTIPSPTHASPSYPSITEQIASRQPSVDLTEDINDTTILAPSLHPLPLSESPSLLSLSEPLGPSTINTTNSAPPTLPSTPEPLLPSRPQTLSRILSTTITTTIPLADPFSPERPTTSHPSTHPLSPPISLTTKTITIPLKDEDSKTITVPLKDEDLPYSPASTMTREQALEQIRQRRGRARSIAAGNGTPRKVMGEVAVRREFSAPQAGAGVGRTV